MTWEQTLHHESMQKDKEFKHVLEQNIWLEIVGWYGLLCVGGMAWFWNGSDAFFGPKIVGKVFPWVSLQELQFFQLPF